MNKPTFLIVGAAKAGTTSVYHYLNQHPQIFMPVPKEPKFFSSCFTQFPLKGPGDALIESRIIKTGEEYYNLFSNLSGEVTQIGDASADNLYYYEQAIPLIKEQLGDPSILIFLRNPVQRAFSAYAHLIREGRENLDFREALDAEEERIANNYEFLWHYKKVGLYASQVKAYQENFSSVKVFLLEDIVADKNAVIEDIFSFLEVRQEIPIENERIYNASGRPKSGMLFKLLKYPNPVKNTLKVLFPKKVLQHLRRSVDSINLTKMNIDEPSAEYLRNYYRHDIYSLESLINRKLTHWLN